MSNKSPLRYPGGKTRACKKLDEIINKYFKIDECEQIISPFFGGGSFEFYLQNKYNKKIIANDKFAPLFNFWQQVQINKTNLCLELKKKINTTKEDFTKYRKEIINLDNIELQAIYYFIINRCSFSGATLSGGFSQEASQKRFTLSSIDRINNLNLDNIVFYNEDFETFINKHIYNNETNILDSSNILKTLMFLDPPYYLENKSKLYGNNGDLHENFPHQTLFEVINKKKNWILTYNNCEFIRDLYKNYRILDVNWSYGMNKSKKSSEIVIICN